LNPNPAFSDFCVNAKLQLELINLMNKEDVTCAYVFQFDCRGLKIRTVKKICGTISAFDKLDLQNKLKVIDSPMNWNLIVLPNNT
jgi:hypothetical protein